jgi:hypothetical protein
LEWGFDTASWSEFSNRRRPVEQPGGVAGFPTHLTRGAGRLSNRDAHTLVHRGRFLDKFPALADAARDGVLSSSQIGALKTACPAAVEAVMAG